MPHRRGRKSHPNDDALSLVERGKASHAELTAAGLNEDDFQRMLGDHQKSRDQRNWKNLPYEVRPDLNEKSKGAFERLKQKVLGGW